MPASQMTSHSTFLSGTLYQGGTAGGGGGVVVGARFMLEQAVHQTRLIRPVPPPLLPSNYTSLSQQIKRFSQLCSKVLGDHILSEISDGFTVFVDTELLYGGALHQSRPRRGAVSAA